MEMNGIDYTGDPRAVLCHFNEKHDNLGRFAKKSGGVSAPAMDYDSTTGKYKNPLVEEVTNSGGKAGLWETRKRSQAVVEKAINSNMTADDVFSKMIDAYLTPEAMRDSPYLRSKIGTARFHSTEDYLSVAPAIADAVWQDVGIAMQGTLSDYGANEEEQQQAIASLREQMIAGKMPETLTNLVGKRLREVYDNQQYKPQDYLAGKAREKNVEGSTSVHRRITNAEQAYREVSSQRAKDIQNKMTPKSASEAYAAASAQRNRDLKKKLKHDGLTYEDDPRAVLIHANPYHDPKNGQFTNKQGGQAYTFGMSKYVNRDGSLTKEGQRRLALAVQRNKQKKKDDQIKGTPAEIEKILTDPHKWVSEDLDAVSSGFKSSQDLINVIQKVAKDKQSRKPMKRLKKMKLDEMTDAELREQIDRYNLEQRYLDTFNPKVQEVSKGHERLMKILEVSGGVLAVGASAVTIAKAIHEMKK